MAKVAITEEFLGDIADAIRAKTGLSDNYYPSEMADAIMAISGGGGITPTGTISITENGIYNVTTYASADVDVPTGSTINNQTKTNINPSTSSQTITYDSGYTGLESVQINAMPSGSAGTPTATKGTVSNHSISVTPSVTNTAGYIVGGTITGTAVTVNASELVSGTKSISANGTGIDVTNYASVNVAVSGGSPVINALDITPSESEQTFDSSSVDGYKPVIVGAISSTYVGSEIARRSSTNLTVSGAAITAPAGYYAESASKSVASGTAGTPVATKGTVSNHSVSITPSVTNTTGYITGSTKTGTAVTVSASELVSGSETKTSNGTYDVTNLAELVVNVSSSPTIQSLSVTPSTSEQTFNSSSVDGYKPVIVGAIQTETKTNINPTTSSQTITPSSGKYLTSVQINAMPTMTLPTAVSSTSSGTAAMTSPIGRSTSVQYINIPTGYNSTAKYYQISATPNGSATGPSSITQSSASITTGTNTITLTKTNVSTTPTVSAGYVSSATASTATVTLTASVTTKAATTYNTSSTDQTITSGTYLTGTQTIKAVTVSGLSADKVLSGTTVKIGDANDDDRIASVAGSVTFQTYYTGSSAPSSSLGVDGDIYLQS